MVIFRTPLQNILKNPVLNTTQKIAGCYSRLHSSASTNSLSMKNILLLLSLLCLSITPVLAQLNTGDIMFVGFMGDGNGGDDGMDFNCGNSFAFAALVDIPANTTIHFCESEWNGSDFLANEGDISWSNSAITPSGTIINITHHSQFDACATISASVGTAVFTSSGATIDESWGTSSINEEIYAFLGSVRNPTTWLAAFISDNANSQNVIPTELNGFVIDFTTVDPDVDVAILSGDVNCDNREDCLAFITDLSNWNTEDEDGAGDCCNDTGVSYPGDLPENLSPSIVCPTVGPVAASPGSLCQDAMFDVTVTGLMNMASADNNDADYGIRFVAHAATTTDPYTGGTNLATVAFGSLGGGGTSASITGQSIATPGTYFIYAILSPTPADTDCRPSAMTTLTVNANPEVSFTALADVCVDVGIQAGLGGGNPMGGVYNGPGVTDDGNGNTYSFDPTSAGVGVHTITYTFTNANGCTSSASDQVEVFATPEVSFTALADLCIDAGIQAGLGSGNPMGGVYSGPGVTDDGNGSTYSFDPAAAGAGTPTITYTFTNTNGCASSASDQVEVFALPTVSFTSSISTVNVDDGVQTGVSGGSPTGGVYSGPGVTDDGNGMTFTFDPASAGTGEVIVTYTFTDGNGCSDDQSAVITVTDIQLAGDICSDAIDVNNLFGGDINTPVVSDVQDNTGYNADNDPGSGYECWFGDAPVLNNTIWYAFTGDGEKYTIRSVQCDTINPMINTDTQFALYSGDCTTPVAVACNDDEDFDNQDYNSFLEITTEVGVDYLLMVDGYVAAADYAAIGTFCLEVTKLETVGVQDINQTAFNVYPNPTTGWVQLDGFTADRIEVMDQLGRTLRTQAQVGNGVDLSGLPAGVYVLKMTSGTDIYSAKVVKE